MYYVIQVAPGTEDKVEEQIQAMVGKEMYGRCFHPMRHMRKKFRGKWTEVHEKLLPGYVFITSDQVRELYLKLRRVPAVTKLIGLRAIVHRLSSQSFCRLLLLSTIYCLFWYIIVFGVIFIVMRI